jgi:hypothetical protein
LSIKNKRSTDYADVHRLYAPLEYNGRIIPVKITVKALKSELEGKRIYSLEAVDAEIK